MEKINFPVQVQEIEHYVQVVVSSGFSSIKSDDINFPLNNVL